MGRLLYWTCCASVSVIFAGVILLDFCEKTSAQLDLPSMPGPPYPDPRGQNRWGVKFDPRVHGPPYDKREGSSHRNSYRRPPRRRPRPQKFQEDSYWSPARFRDTFKSNSGRRPPNRFYGNDFKRKRPQSYLKQWQNNHNNEDDNTEDKEININVNPNQSGNENEKQAFWNRWNKWYRNIRDHKSTKYVVQGTTDDEVTSTTPITLYIDLDDLKDTWGYKTPKEEVKPKGLKGHYMSMMKGIFNRARSMTGMTGGTTLEDNTEEQSYQKPKTESTSDWAVFTTLGKGLDAASGAMSSVRKAVGGSVLSLPMKYGGKMAADAIVNVGSSAIAKAIKSAAFL